MKRHNFFMRPASIFVSLILLVAVVLPLVHGSKAHAFPSYAQITSRSIEMSSSANGATGVSYKVTFQAATSTLIKGIDVDFCSTSPIMGDTCTAPSGFSLGTPSVSGVSIAGESAGTWSASTINTGRTFELSNGSATGAILNNTTSTFTITTVTNPTTTNTTFYARILTFDTTTNAGNYTDTGTDTGLTDAGGIALSTAAQITITAKVQEELTFCVDANATALTSCGSASGTTIALGDNHGVLSTNFPAVDTTGQYLAQTNAATGAAIRIFGTTLTSGSSTIPALEPTPTTSSAGTSQFGLCTYPSGGTTANLSVVTNYNGGGTTPFNCRNATQSAGLALTADDSGGASYYLGTAAQATYGDSIATQSAGAFTTGTLVFMANTSAVQAAGIYTTTMTFIATGTY